MSEPIEQELKLLFDYQSFENNADLLKLKQQSEERFKNRLNEDDLVFVNAAGEIKNDISNSEFF